MKPLFPYLKGKALICLMCVLAGLFLVHYASAQQSKLVNNTLTPLVNTTTGFNSLIVTSSTHTVIGIPPTADDFANKERIINEETNDVSSWSPIAFATAWVEVKDNEATGGQVYPAGSYAGFVIGNSGLATVGLTATITTYLGNSNDPVDSYDVPAPQLKLLNLLGGSKATVGFNSGGAFDRIRITFGVGLNLFGNISVYHAVVKKYSAGPELACNTNTSASNPAFPTSVNMANSGVTTGLSVGDIEGYENVVSPAPDDYATVIMAVSVGGSASISVKDYVTEYPAGTFVGFAIENSTLASVSALGGIQITAYNNGALVGTPQSGGSLVAGGSLLSSSGRQVVGFVTTQPVDEVQITFNQGLVSVDLGETHVYNAVFKKFCEGPEFTCAPPPVVTAPANTLTQLTSPAYPITADANQGGLIGIGNITNADYIIDSEPDNYATLALNVGALASTTISVKKELSSFPANTFAGFDISSASLAALNLLNGLTVETYENGVATGESISGASLLTGSTFLDGRLRRTVGFLTRNDYDEIRLTITQPVGIDLGDIWVYGAVVQPFCASEELACNTPTIVSNPSHAVYVDGANTGVNSGVCIDCSIDDSQHLVDSNPLNYAQINLTGAVLGTATVAVANAIETYPVGTFAGFDIELPTLADVSVLPTIRVETYLNGDATGEYVETVTFAQIGTGLLAGSGRQTIGFLATEEFDEVKLTIVKPASISLGEIKVYGAVLTRFCAADALACNELTPVTNPDYPIYVDAKNTGIDAVACIACSLSNSQNAVDNDPDNYAEIDLNGAIGASASFAVADALQTYGEKTFAGFDIAFESFLSADVLSRSIRIDLLNNGNVVQTGATTNVLAGVSAPLLGAGYERQIVGIIADAGKQYDEVRITFNQLVSVDLGKIRVYGAVFSSTCPKAIVCNSSYYLNGGANNFPVFINAERTGVTGLANIGEAWIEDPWNVVSSDPDDFATIRTDVSLASAGTISVRDALTTYPAGTTAGFTIRNMSSLAQAEVFSTIRIRTYLNGEFQEESTNTNLIDLELLDLDLLGDVEGAYNLGFVTSYPFNEVQIVVGGLAVAEPFTNETRVYGAYIDTRTSVGGDLVCNPVTNPDFNVTHINVPATGDLNANDNVPDGTTYGPYTSDPGNPSGATFTLEDDGTYTFTAAEPGVYTYNVPVNIPGAEDPVNVPFTVTVTDPAVATNDPVVNPDIASVEGAGSSPGSVAINVTANDGPGNTGGTLGDPTVVAGQGPAHGTAVPDANGNIVYTPEAGYYGPDQFTYEVCETPSGECGTATVYVTVTDPASGINTTVAADDYASVTQGITATGNVLDNDTDPEGDNQLVVVPNTVTVPNVGTFEVLADGSYTFDPEDDFKGPVSFPYTVYDDGSPSASSTGTIYFLVSPAVTPVTSDPGPVANPDFAVTHTLVPVSGDLSANDILPEGAVYGPATPGPDNRQGTTFTLNEDGTYTFTATSDGIYTYTVLVTLPDESTLEVPFVITVTSPEPFATNQPIANLDIASVQGAASDPGTLTIDVTANDGPGNPGGTLGAPTIATGQGPAHGSVSVVDGKIEYTPEAGYYGPDQFTYEVCETPSGECATATVYVTVTDPASGVNTTVAADDYASVTQAVTATGNVLDNDTDPEGNTQLVVVPNTSTIAGTGTFTVLADGSYTFVPDPGFTGPVSFPYAVSDNGTPSATATATIHFLVSAPVVVNPGAPELKPFILLSQSTIHGPAELSFMVRIGNNIPNNLSTGVITVKIPKNQVPAFTWEPTGVNFSGLGPDHLDGNNADWTYDDSDATDHIWTTTKQVGKGASIAFGFKGTYTPTAKGSHHITVTLVGGSGGETGGPDKQDRELLVYFTN